MKTDWKADVVWRYIPPDIHLVGLGGGVMIGVVTLLVSGGEVASAGESLILGGDLGSSVAAIGIEILITGITAAVLGGIGSLVLGVLFSLLWSVITWRAMSGAK